jgi:hypothetical protein
MATLLFKEKCQNAFVTNLQRERGEKLFKLGKKYILQSVRPD